MGTLKPCKPKFNHPILHVFYVWLASPMVKQNTSAIIEITGTWVGGNEVDPLIFKPSPYKWDDL